MRRYKITIVRDSDTETCIEDIDSAEALAKRIDSLSKQKAEDKSIKSCSVYSI